MEVFVLLKFFKKSRKRMFVLIIILGWNWFGFWNLLTQQNFNLTDILVTSLIFAIILVLYDWSWNSRSYNKKKQ